MIPAMIRSRLSEIAGEIDRMRLKTRSRRALLSACRGGPSHDVGSNQFHSWWRKTAPRAPGLP
jgi:hypothetical protein